MKKAASAFGIIIGIVSVIMSIITFNMYVGYFESSKTYGGDAYTGIQQASAQSANNIVHAAKILRFGLGSVLLILGLGMIVYFAMKLGESDTTGLSGVANNGIGAVPSTSVGTNNQNTNTVTQSAPSPSPAAPVITKKPVDDWVCPKCGNRNSKIVTKCLNCDAEKPEPPVGNNAPKFQFLESETESPKRPGNDWICPKCGSKNSRLVTKCMNCDAMRDN